MLVLYCSLSVAIGKHVRSFCFQIFAESGLVAKTNLFNLKYGGDAESSESEETDSEDSEETDTDNDDHELTQNHFHQVALASQPGLSQTSFLLSDHHQEISTPPPRF